MVHPSREKAMQEPHTCIPMRIWGDDAVVTKQKSLYAVTICSLLCTRIAAFLSRFLAFAAPTCTFVSLDPLWQILGWDFDNLASGCLASHDHLGQHFASGSMRFANRGKRIAGLFVFLVASVTGDLKFLVETFKFPQNYSCEAVCWQCYGVKSAGTLCAYNFSLGAPWTLTKRSHGTYILDAGGGVVAVLCLPGLHLTMIGFDLMHTLHLGVLAVELGSAFFCYWNSIFGTRLPVVTGNQNFLCNCNVLGVTSRVF